MFTSCKTRPPDPPPIRAPVYGWWCAARDDGFGVCFKVAGHCEAYRGTINPKICKGSAPGQCTAALPECTYHTLAFCGVRFCFTTLVGCAAFERESGQDGAACMARQ